MLRITADVYSGLTNPVVDITDEGEARVLLRELQQDPSLLSDAATADGNLGFRGFQVDPLSDEIAQDFDITTGLYLPARALQRGGRAPEIAERLLDLMERGEAPAALEGATPLDGELKEYVLEHLQSSGTETAEDQTAPPSPDQEEAAAVCTYDLSVFNPGFWNNDANVRANNNCYNYASNWRTNTFAQPGRGCGHMYTAISCSEVSRGALCDGMHRRFNCFPDSEKPRYLVALVIAPGPGFRDYHWFRKQSGGFWGHKPGGTAARNTDNSGVLITNPETANRGPYTQFCGYFYGCNSQRQRIR